MDSNKCLIEDRNPGSLQATDIVRILQNDADRPDFAKMAYLPVNKRQLQAKVVDHFANGDGDKIDEESSDLGKNSISFFVSTEEMEFLSIQNINISPFKSDVRCAYRVWCLLVHILSVTAFRNHIIYSVTRLTRIRNAMQSSKTTFISSENDDANTVGYLFVVKASSAFANGTLAFCPREGKCYVYVPMTTGDDDDDDDDINTNAYNMSSIVTGAVGPGALGGGNGGPHNKRNKVEKPPPLFKFSDVVRKTIGRITEYLSAVSVEVENISASGIKQGPNKSPSYNKNSLIPTRLNRNIEKVWPNEQHAAAWLIGGSAELPTVVLVSKYLTSYGITTQNKNNKSNKFYDIISNLPLTLDIIRNVYLRMNSKGSDINDDSAISRSDNYVSAVGYMLKKCCLTASHQSTQVGDVIVYEDEFCRYQSMINWIPFTNHFGIDIAVLRINLMKETNGNALSPAQLMILFREEYLKYDEQSCPVVAKYWDRVRGSIDPEMIENTHILRTLKYLSPDARDMLAEFRSDGDPLIKIKKTLLAQLKDISVSSYDLCDIYEQGVGTQAFVVWMKMLYSGETEVDGPRQIMKRNRGIASEPMSMVIGGSMRSQDAFEESFACMARKHTNYTLPNKFRRLFQTMLCGSWLRNHYGVILPGSSGSGKDLMFTALSNIGYPFISTHAFTSSGLENMMDQCKGAYLAISEVPHEITVDSTSGNEISDTAARNAYNMAIEGLNPRKLRSAGYDSSIVDALESVSNKNSAYKICIILNINPQPNKVIDKSSKARCIEIVFKTYREGGKIWSCDSQESIRSSRITRAVTLVASGAIDSDNNELVGPLFSKLYVKPLTTWVRTWFASWISGHAKNVLTSSNIQDRGISNLQSLAFNSAIEQAAFEVVSRTGYDGSLMSFGTAVGAVHQIIRFCGAAPWMEAIEVSLSLFGYDIMWVAQVQRMYVGMTDEERDSVFSENASMSKIINDYDDNDYTGIDVDNLLPIYDAQYSLNKPDQERGVGVYVTKDICMSIISMAQRASGIAVGQEWHTSFRDAHNTRPVRLSDAGSGNKQQHGDFTSAGNSSSGNTKGIYISPVDLQYAIPIQHANLLRAYGSLVSNPIPDETTELVSAGFESKKDFIDYAWGAVPPTDPILRQSAFPRPWIKMPVDCVEDIFDTTKDSNIVRILLSEPNKDGSELVMTGIGHFSVGNDITDMSTSTTSISTWKATYAQSLSSSTSSSSSSEGEAEKVGQVWCWVQPVNSETWNANVMAEIARANGWQCVFETHVNLWDVVCVSRTVDLSFMRALGRVHGVSFESDRLFKMGCTKTDRPTEKFLDVCMDKRNSRYMDFMKKIPARSLIIDKNRLRTPVQQSNVMEHARWVPAMCNTEWLLRLSRHDDKKAKSMLNILKNTIAYAEPEALAIMANVMMINEENYITDKQVSSMLISIWHYQVRNSTDGARHKKHFEEEWKLVYIDPETREEARPSKDAIESYRTTGAILSALCDDLMGPVPAFYNKFLVKNYPDESSSPHLHNVSIWNSAQYHHKLSPVWSASTVICPPKKENDAKTRFIARLLGPESSSYMTSNIKEFRSRFRINLEMSRKNMGYKRDVFYSTVGSGPENTGQEDNGGEQDGELPDKLVEEAVLITECISGETEAPLDSPVVPVVMSVYKDSYREFRDAGDSRSAGILGISGQFQGISIDRNSSRGAAAAGTTIGRRGGEGEAEREVFNECAVTDSLLDFSDDDDDEEDEEDAV